MKVGERFEKHVDRWLKIAKAGFSPDLTVTYRTADEFLVLEIVDWDATYT